MGQLRATAVYILRYSYWEGHWRYFHSHWDSRDAERQWETSRTKCL